MLTPWRTLRKPPNLPSPHHQHRLISDHHPFQPGDLVLLREKSNRSAPPILSKPLHPGKKNDSHKGSIPHDSILGKRARDVVPTLHLKSGREGTEYRLHEVKLEEYVRFSRRLVTPVYPADANVIVDLLDLHPEVYYAAEGGGGGGEGAKLEILEAGTGHGALTLYLSRAIHAANNPPLSRTEDDDHEAALKAWKHHRKAIIHTLDISEKYSTHARNVVKGFRHGLYYPNIDFHVADVGQWTREQLAHQQRPFLSHAILDLPNADKQIAEVTAALRTDGTLIVFNPSITQILQCASKIREEVIPLELERVIELPVNGGAGGREWDVRPVRPRAALKSNSPRDRDEGATTEREDSGVDVDGGGLEEVTAATRSVSPAAAEKDEGWQMVCRPKVGDRIIGGGFLGVWKKKRGGAVHR